MEPWNHGTMEPSRSYIYNIYNIYFLFIRKNNRIIGPIAEKGSLRTSPKKALSDLKVHSCDISCP